MGNDKNVKLGRSRSSMIILYLRSKKKRGFFLLLHVQFVRFLKYRKISFLELMVFYSLSLKLSFIHQKLKGRCRTNYLVILYM